MKAEFRIGNSWVNVTGRVYTRDPITTVYGMSAEGTRVDPSSCSLTLNNRNGDFSPRNPLSPYYGLLGRNTPLRITVPLTESYLDLDGTEAATASTPDAAALDITSDIDVRVEATADWYATGVQNLMGKWNSTTAQRSWLLQLENGLVRLRFSSDGTITSFGAFPLPALPPRAAVRVTLDVNNGAGGWTVTGWWAESLDGPWTSILSGTVPGGTTSIFNSTAPVVIAPTSTTIVPNWMPMRGRVHRAEVRNGINGSIVAAPDFRAQAPGTSSFADTPGRTWTVNAPAEVTDREYLFSGEVSSWPPRWAPSGRDVWTPIEGAGILRRLGQGRKPVGSALSRSIIREPSVLAYWPMEEGETSTQAYSPIAGVRPLTLTNAAWGAADTLVASGPLPKLDSTVGVPWIMSGVVPAPAAPITGWQVRWLYRLDSQPASLATFMRILCTGGTVVEWVLQSRVDLSRLIGLDIDGNTVLSQDVITGTDLFNRWNSARLELAQSGGNVLWKVVWQDVGGDAGFFDGSFPGTIGRVRSVGSFASGFSALLDGMAIGHIGVFGTNVIQPVYNGAWLAYAGETASDRLRRLGAEEPRLGISVVEGDPKTGSAPMGAQRPGALLALVEECAESDGGILAERPDRLGLLYRDRASLYNQPIALTLDYAAGHLVPPLEPVEDDQHVRNDVSVERVGGSSARVVVEEGPLSALPPEDGGVGIYDETVTLSLGSDDQPLQIAAWRAHLGTWNEARYPSVKILLHRQPQLIPDVLKLRIGDRIRILNPPTWVGTGPVDLHVQQIAHTPRSRTWEVTLSCAPAGPWQVGVLDDPDLARLDTQACVINAPVSATATTLTVDSTQTRWVDFAGYPAEFPFLIRVGGEVMRVTAITGTTLAQTMTVVRSINGIVKSHPQFAQVELATPMIIPL
ncbi:hypothetical protein [Streptomyces liangshanensis]|uniref:hypothetical protein n=1 Tax=Streptomyces liangshanensis TaxID=2717324 RepID=UPI0036DB59C0